MTTTSTYYGPLTTVRIAQADIRSDRLDHHEVALIDGTWYYLSECEAGTGILACRSCSRQDYGGNTYETREAPASLVGIAAHEGAIPCRSSYSAPAYLVEIV